MANDILTIEPKGEDLLADSKEVVREIATGLAFEEHVKRISYRPLSTSPAAKTLMPANLAGETLFALAKLKEEEGDIDEYVRLKLEYPSKLSLFRAFNGEQIDAIALAIYQIEQGKGFLIGDMAGIGKGRTLAGMMRYAFLKGNIPMFITYKPALFSDIYRDIKAIEGFRHNVDGSVFIPTPFIINGYDPEGSTSILGGKREIIFEAQKRSELDKVYTDVVKKELPFDTNKFQVILATYSQFSSKKASLRAEFMLKISPSCVFCLDESHNASGSESNTGNLFKELVATSSGTMFASATSAKVPKEIMLYALKTDIKDSVTSTDKLLQTITKVGEPLMEYLSSMLVKSGQMIRRERSFDDCPIGYKVMDADRDKVWNLYDDIIIKYNQMVKFVKTSSYTDAIKNAVDKVAEEKKLPITHTKPPKTSAEKKQWKIDNAGKYYYTTGVSGVMSSRFLFIENLLFSLKSEYVGNTAVEQLSNWAEYTYNDGSVKVVNKKPIIAVRATLETIFDKAGYNVGDVIERPDFALILQTLLRESLKFTVTFKKVDPTVAVTGSSSRPNPRPAEGKPSDDDKITIGNNIIELEDFPDGGAIYTKMMEELSSYVSNIFISPIDRLIETVEIAKRDAAKDKWGTTSNYNVAEITGRKYMIRKNADGNYVLFKNTRHQNSGDAFYGYNEGVYDCLIINESGSTGASAHSALSYKDQRPRAMIIHQVELDVNIEVQKRGRINRTGQVNSPTYIYVTSPIPAEIRRMLMLKRKMRSLDAIVTGNQRQNDDLTAFRDSNGIMIEDFYNSYGSKTLTKFLDVEENEYYRQYSVEDWTDSMDKSAGSDIDAFARQLELAPAEKQNYFYDQMNGMYIEDVRVLKENNEYMLETTIDDLKASIKARAEIKMGVNTSLFNIGIFEEENWVNATNKVLSKAEMLEIKDSLCEGKREDKWHAEFIEKYKAAYDEYERITIEEKLKTKPSTEGMLPLIAAQVDEIFQEGLDKMMRNLTFEKERVLGLLTYFVPWKIVMMPKNIEAYQEDPEGVELEFMLGRFLGYVVQDRKAKFRYSSGNLLMRFAFLDTLPKFSVTPAPRQQELLEIAMEESKKISRLNLSLIESWTVDTNKRERMRTLSGNIIEAMFVAEARKQAKTLSQYKYIKYTTLDGEIKNAIRMWYKAPTTITGSVFVMPEFQPEHIDVAIPSINAEFEAKIKVMADTQIATVVANRGAERIAAKEDNGIVKKYFALIDERVKMNRDGSYSSYANARVNLHSVFFDDVNIEQFFNTKPEVKYQKVSIAGVEKKTEVRLKVFPINSHTNLKGLGKYLYDIDKSAFVFFGAGAITEETVLSKPDEFQAEIHAELTPQEILGDFNYELTEPYDATVKVRGFVSFDENQGDYGVVKTNVMLRPIECNQYRFVPLSHTPQQKAFNFLALFDGNERRLLIKKLVAMKDEKPVEVGLFINDEIPKRGFISPTPIFGKMSLGSIGSLMVQYVTSEDVSALVIEEEPEVTTVSARKPVTKKPMNMENIMDYLILLNVS